MGRVRLNELMRRFVARSVVRHLSAGGVLADRIEWGALSRNPARQSLIDFATGIDVIDGSGS